MEKLFDNKNQCCGCTACMNVCPKGAISMVADSSGFEYPQIDKTLCIDCGLCKSVCAFQNGYKKGEAVKTVFAAKNNSSEIRANSSSGGVFSQLAKHFIDNGGVVYGAAFDNDLVVRHICVDESKELKKLRSSKYVQSKLDFTFKEIKQKLDKGQSVLFSGTGCQVGALKGYLKKDYDNLLTVDIVCHGTPSPKLFADYKAFMEKKYGSKAVAFNFRAKKIYGETQDMAISFENGKIYSEFPAIDVYKSLFSRNLSLRPSCFECKYTNINRPSDITLGDFWGIDKCIPNFNDKKGVTLVIPNSEKGRKLFESVKSSFAVKETAIENALQPNLKAPTKKPDGYEAFQNDYCTNGFDYIANKYAKTSALTVAKARINNTVKKLLKK